MISSEVDRLLRDPVLQPKYARSIAAGCLSCDLEVYSSMPFVLLL